MRYHYISIRMAKIKNSDNSKYWPGCGENGSLIYCWWEWKMVKPLWKTIWPFLIKLNMQLPYNSTTTLRWSAKFPKKWKFMFTQKPVYGASLVAQWLRICLPTQGTRVRALVWEDPTCREATRPVSHNYWACASGDCAPQQERPR